MFQEIELSEIDVEFQVSAFEIFNYPSRTDPRLALFIIRNCTTNNTINTIVDPFGGIGTVGIVSSILGLKSISIDLNPVLGIVYNSLSNDLGDFKVVDIKEMLLSFSDKIDTPDWAAAWYPDKLLYLNASLWRFIASQPENVKYLLAIAGFKISRLFSLYDERFHKPSKTQYSINKVKNFLSSENLNELFYNSFINEVLKIVNKIYQLKGYLPEKLEMMVESGTDVLEYSLPLKGGNVAVITEPPPFRQHEYIRSCRPELLWLGYSAQELNNLSKFEINGFNTDYQTFTETIKRAVLRFEPQIIALIVATTPNQNRNDVKNTYIGLFSQEGYSLKDSYVFSRNVSRLFKQHRNLERNIKEKIVLIFEK